MSRFYGAKVRAANTQADIRGLSETKRPTLDGTMEKTGRRRKGLAKAILKKWIEKNGGMPRRIVILLHDVKAGSSYGGCKLCEKNKHRVYRIW